MGWEDFTHHTEVWVRFGDTDPFGIVYFVSYFRYCHRAIEEYLRALGLKPEETFRNVPEEFGLPIVEAHCRFRRPARYGDRLTVATRIQELRPRAIIFGFEFFLPPSDEVVARGTANLVAINRQWQAIELPERIREILSHAGGQAGAPA